MGFTQRDDVVVLENSGPRAFHATLKRDDGVVSRLDVTPLHKRPGYKHTARVELEAEVNAAEIASLLGRLLTIAEPRCKEWEIRELVCFLSTDKVAFIDAFLSHGFRRVIALQGVSATDGGAAGDVLALQKTLAPAPNRPADAVDWSTHLSEDVRAVLRGDGGARIPKQVWDDGTAGRGVSEAYVIRDATVVDVQGTLDIYNHEVLQSTVTADYTPASLEDRYEWFNQFGGDKAGGRERPLLVAIERASGVVAGYCAICEFSFVPGCDT
ncbi:hypothetical protein HK101_011401 [Irineochytrium annulatum]|nr:hypothetical protein HK101_011401 [Irineochytrium annulatum]